MGTTKLEQGQWCCEAALWMYWIHRGKMKALTSAELLGLHVERFCEATATHPEAHMLARGSALKFWHDWNTGDASITDIPTNYSSSHKRMCAVELKKAEDF